jgi:hypothetical protein
MRATRVGASRPARPARRRDVIRRRERNVVLARKQGDERAERPAIVPEGESAARTPHLLHRLFQLLLHALARQPR